MIEEINMSKKDEAVDAVDAVDAPEDDGKVRIRPNVEKYTSAKSASGAKSQHNGDPVATALAGATVAECTKILAELSDVSQKSITEKYAHLNVGQQRMNIGNRIRGAVNKLNKAEEGTGDKNLAAIAEPIGVAVAARIEKEAKAKADAAAKAEAKAKAETEAA